MLWELSTPFVFMRWLLHSLGRQHTKLYLANGVAMIVVFLLCRNVLGIGAVLFSAVRAAFAWSFGALPVFQSQVIAWLLPTALRHLLTERLLACAH